METPRWGPVSFHIPTGGNPSIVVPSLSLMPQTDSSQTHRGQLCRS